MADSSERDLIQAKTTAARLKALYREERIQAAQAVGRLGPRGEAAIPLLLEALDDPDPGVVAAVAKALAGMGPAAVEPLAMAVLDKQYEYRLPVIVALGELGQAGAVQPLCQVLRSEDMEAKREALQSLGQLGPLAIDALAAIQLAEQDEALRPLARAAMQQIEGRGQLAEFFHWNLMVVLAILVAVVGGLAILNLGQQVLALDQASRIPALVAFGWFLIGGVLGGVMGWHIHGKGGALRGFLLFGLGGAFAGYLIGTLAATAVEPFVKAMGGK
jgi:hypothetical protein